MHQNVKVPELDYSAQEKGTKTHSSEGEQANIRKNLSGEN